MIDSIAIRGLFRNLTFLVVLTIAFLALAALPSVSEAQGPPTLTQSLDIKVADMSITVRYPDNWSVAPEQFVNSWKLINVPADQQETTIPTARVKVSAETRIDHADALKQLQELGTGLGVDPSELLEIGGWPALQVSQLEERPQPSQGPQFEDKYVLRITTAIAAGKLLVHLDASLPSNANQTLIGEAKAIGSSVAFSATGNSGQLQNELEGLRSLTSKTSSLDLSASGASLAFTAPPEAESSSEEPLPGANQRVFTASFGELEIAMSPDGQNIVIGKNIGRWVASNDGGQTFPLGGTVAAFNSGDPSLAYGQSGAFYYAGIRGGCLPPDIPGPYGYTCTGMARSTDNGASFPLTGNAVVCPNADPAGIVVVAGSCFPDQEHIGADRTNMAPGGDQVYSTWRNFDATDQDAGLVCSQDNGATWTAPFDLGANSSFPRIAVGQNGFVYVAAYGGGNYRLWKFSSCQSGLALQAGFPLNVVARIPVVCPFPGHDRCDQNPSSQTVAVDDTNPNHIYYAFSENTAPGNEDIIVQDSLDGGATWPGARRVQVNAAVPSPRIMPWLCTTGGDAFVTWYDRRAATPCPAPPCFANNDTTDYFAGSAGLDGVGSLVAKGEFKVSDVADPWCASGWPCQTRQAPGASESCSVQPQLAGQCCILDGMGNCTGASSFTPCDFSDCGGLNMNGGGACQCPVTDVCTGGGGCPKYGDYNGNACAAGRLCAAWASRLSPPGVPPPAMGSIGVLFECTLEGDVPQIQVPGITFPDTCVGSTSVATLNVCNTGNGNLEVNSITSSDVQFNITTPSGGYPVIISPDFCFPFQVNFTPVIIGFASATLTILSNDPANPSLDVAVSGIGGESKVTTSGELNFGDTCTGDSNTQTVQVCNTGSCNLTVTGATLVPGGGDGCDDLTIVNPPTFPLTISPDFCFDFEVKYKPDDSTTPTCSLQITTDDPATPTITFPITASVPVQDINVSIANSGNFGDVCSVDLKDLNLQVINQGACDLTITAITSSNPTNFIVPQTLQLPLVLSPNATADVPIRFDPDLMSMPACHDTTPRTANITITSDDPDEANIIQAVSGIVPCPNATQKGQLDFGELCIGDRKADTIEVCNTGKCNLTVTGVALVPGAGGDGCDDLAIINPPTLPLTISKDFCFNFEVEFTPDDLIDPDCSLQITTDDPDTPIITFPITATVGEPNIVLDPPALTGIYAFPATVAEPGGLGCFSDKMLVIRNNGTCPLVISGIGASATPPFSVIAPTIFPITLPVGEETLKVTVRFDPTSAPGSASSPDDVTGTLTVMSNDPQGDATGGLCGEPVGQSGVRELVVFPSEAPIPSVDSLILQSKGINTPSPIFIKLTDAPFFTDSVCTNTVRYHLNREDLPTTQTTGSNPRSSYITKAKDGNKQASKSFSLGQCEFKEFILKLK